MAVNGFCPKCGAVIHDGKCASCGYSVGKFSGSINGETTHTSKVQKTGSHVGAVVLLFIISWIVFIGVVIIILFSQTKNIFDGLGGRFPVSPEPDYNYNWDFEENIKDYWDEDYTYGEYAPSPSDDFYKEFVSSTVRGLSYDIAWSSTNIYPDDEESYAGYSYTYPIVIGKDKAFLSDINAAIYEQVMFYEPVALEGENWGYVDCYVTYMTEDILSVLFSYYRDTVNEESYKLAALNFDMVTGEIISNEDMLPSYDYIITFRNNCNLQNDYSSSVMLQSMKDEEIIAAITSSETGVIFYTPVGLEMGFNYPEGWMTVTMKTGTY